LAAINPSKGIGLDPSAKMVQAAQEKFPHLKFQQGDLETMDINETFDYIIVGNVMGFSDDLQKAFNQLKKVCHPKTRIICVYNNQLWRPVLKITELLKLRMPWPKQHWLAVKDIKNLLKLCDYSVVTQSQQILLPFHIPLLSTFFNKFLVHLPILRNLAMNHFLIVRPVVSELNPEDVSVSIIVPCRNEKGNIEQVIMRTPVFSKSIEFIFVEGHSEDGTFEECIRVKKNFPDHNIKVLQQKGTGKADAVREGFTTARGDVLMILDADLTVPPESMPAFFHALIERKGEFINGSRLVYSMEKEAMQFLNMIANKFFSLAFTYLLGQYLKDTLCGTKVLFKEDYNRIEEGRSYFGNFDPFGDFDLLFGAAKLHLKIVEIPVHYKARTYGSTQISRFRHGWLLIKMTFFAMHKIRFV